MSYELGRVEEWHRLILFSHIAHPVFQSRAQPTTWGSMPGPGQVPSSTQVIIYWSSNGRDIKASNCIFQSSARRRALVIPASNRSRGAAQRGGGIGGAPDGFADPSVRALLSTTLCWLHSVNAHKHWSARSCLAPCKTLKPASGGQGADLRSQRLPPATQKSQKGVPRPQRPPLLVSEALCRPARAPK